MKFAHLPLLLIILLLIAQNVPAQRSLCDYSIDNNITIPNNEACVYNLMFNGYSTTTDTVARQLITKICQVIYLKPHFSVEPCPGIKTCRAYVFDDRVRYIFYDEDFIKEIVNSNGNNWGLIEILAHEIGHHLSWHTMLKPNGNLAEHRNNELEADEFAGAILAKMGATRAEALESLLQVHHPNCDIEEDSPYPCFEKRKNAVLRGFFGVPLNEVKKNYILSRDLNKIDISSTSNSPVREQLDGSTSVGFSITYAMEYEYQKKYHKPIAISPRYIYNRSGGTEISGLNYRRALDTIKKYGAVEEQEWPYKPNDYDQSKLISCNSIKKRVFVKEYLKLDIDSLEFINQLQIGKAIIAGVVFYEKNENNSTWSYFKDSATNGRHAICIVGYDPILNVFKFKNSWGTFWGDKGYGYFDAKYLKELIRSAYIIEIE